jgi:hypothetical protein
MDGIFCPVIIAAESIKTIDDDCTCLKNACAWYDDANDCCAILSLAKKGRDENA